ncbi:MAG: acetoacetate decarboxylase family protein [Dehalococcoidia bacterium]|nr:acetoacetate decarboxylase family protein [Dehalococcoidia bacterium]
MRLVKTTEEIRRIQSIYSRCHFLGVRTLTVFFETSPEAVAALLPPPLEPAEEPLGTAWVADVGNSNCVGPFQGAALYVRARYGDITGNYCITMPMSTPEAVTFGRELYGEPKKLAKIIFEQQDEHVWGSAERHEVRYLSLRGRMTEAAPTGRQEASSFFFKFCPRADGLGFDAPPQLIHVTADVSTEVAKRGRGEIVFRESPHDPVADLPVRQVLSALYTEGHIYTSGRVLCEVDAEAFLPYAFSKVDAFDLVTEGTLLHAQAARKTREGKGQWRNPS